MRCKIGTCNITYANYGVSLGDEGDTGRSARVRKPKDLDAGGGHSSPTASRSGASDTSSPSRDVPMAMLDEGALLKKGHGNNSEETR